MSNLSQWWGRVPPDGIALAWGARAIYKQGTGPVPDLDLPERVIRGFRSPDSGGKPIIDLLSDRQSWRGPAEGKARSALVEWINATGLPAIREACVGLGPNEDRVVSFSELRYGGGSKWTIEACPNASFGHLYLVAYFEYPPLRDEEDGAVASAPRAGFVDPSNIASGGSLRPEDQPGLKPLRRATHGTNADGERVRLHGSAEHRDVKDLCYRNTDDDGRWNGGHHPTCEEYEPDDDEPEQPWETDPDAWKGGDA